MKLLSIIVALLVSVSVYAQPVTMTGTNEATRQGQEVIIPVMVANLQPVRAVSLILQYDPAVLTFIDGNSTVIPWLQFTGSPGQLTIGGFSPEPATVPNGVLFYARFTYLKGQSQIRWLKSQCEYADANLNPITPASWLDGYIIPTVTISGQTWMAENMAVATPNSKCYVNQPSFCKTHGALYSWDDAMQGVLTEGAQGVCPTGWHIPTIAEFSELAKNTRKDSTEQYKPPVVNPWTNSCGTVLKIANLNANRSKYVWWSRCPGVTPNGFNAIPSGWYYKQYNQFGDLMQTAGFWTSELVPFAATDPRWSDIQGTDPVIFYLHMNSQRLLPGTVNRANSYYSVRCIKN